MLQLSLKLSGKRNETLIAGLRKLADQLEQGIDPDYQQVVHDNQGRRIDGTFDVEITGEPVSYGYFGTLQNGSTKLLAGGYPAAGYCYASATKAAVDIRHAGNPENFVRRGVVDDEGRILPEYENSSLLEV